MFVAVISSILGPDEAEMVEFSAKSWRESLDQSGHNGWIWLYAEGVHICDPGVRQLLVEHRLDVDGPTNSRATGFNKFVAERTADVYIFVRPDIIFEPNTVFQMVEAVHQGFDQFVIVPPSAFAVSRKMARQIFPVPAHPDHDLVMQAISQKVKDLRLAWRCLHFEPVGEAIRGH